MSFEERYKKLINSINDDSENKIEYDIEANKWLSNSISEELDVLVWENIQLIVYDSVSNLTQRVVTKSIGILNERY